MKKTHAPARAWAVSSIAPRDSAAVDHPVGRVVERMHQALAQRQVQADVLHRPGHAAQPLVTLRAADRKRQVPRAQPRMAEAAHVMIGAAQPSAQEPEGLVARALERGRVQRADARELAAPDPSGRRNGRSARAPAPRRPPVRTRSVSIARPRRLHRQSCLDTRSTEKRNDTAVATLRRRAGCAAPGATAPRASSTSRPRPRRRCPPRYRPAPPRD